MKDLGIDIAREYLVRHNKELRSILTSVGRLLPEGGEQVSFHHLSEGHQAAIKAFCNTLTFVVVEVATLPGQQEKVGETINFSDALAGLPVSTSPHYVQRCDAAQILLAPVYGSNFPASNSKCQSILQTEPQPARSEDEKGPKMWVHPAEKPAIEAQSALIMDINRAALGWPIYPEMGRAASGHRKGYNEPVVTVGRAA